MILNKMKWLIIIWIKTEKKIKENENDNTQENKLLKSNSNKIINNSENEQDKEEINKENNENNQDMINYKNNEETSNNENININEESGNEQNNEYKFKYVQLEKDDVPKNEQNIDNNINIELDNNKIKDKIMKII